MSFFLKSKNLDLGEDSDFNIVLHRKDAEKLGVKEGELLLLGIGDVELYADILETETKVNEGEIGLFEEIWKQYKVENGRSIFVDIPQRSKSIEAICRKLQGKDLSKDDLELIMHDIGSKRLRETEVAFFVATFFNPGFNDDEILWMTKGMASSGEILSFKGLRGKNSIVVDKHSIGGVAGKGITPTLVPILAAGGLVVPNTSTRAISSPAGTSDILEVVMPIALEKEKVLDVVKSTGGGMFWGGSLDIAPADDVIINVERSLRIQEFQKVLVSIVAKKIAMGVEYVLIDLPYGKGSKIERVDEVHMLEREFKKLFKNVGIECETMRRYVKGPDGPAVGPNLEIREVLKILERDEGRSLEMEEVVLNMAGTIFEGTEICNEGEGKIFAQDILESKKAYEKFWEIAMAQGAKDVIQSKSIDGGHMRFDVKSERGGTVKMIDNSELVNIARAVGNPKIKEAGIYIHKMPKDSVEKGDILFTIYATTQDRLENGKKAVDLERLYTFI